MFLGKISVLLLVNLIGVAIVLNWIGFKSSLRLVLGLYAYFFISYFLCAKLFSVYPKIWNPIEAGLIDPNTINPSYK